MENSLAVNAARSPARVRARLLHWWSHWPRWTVHGAMGWSAIHVVLGTAWTLGAPGYPFAPVRDDRASASMLEGAPVEVVGPALVAIGVLGVVVAMIMLRNVRARWVRRLTLVFGTVLAVTAACLVPDYTILAILALWPALLVFIFTGVPGAQEGIGDILYWHRIHLIWVFLGGLLWAGATLATTRRHHGACTNCGRSARTSDIPPDRLRTWGRRLVWLAVLATLPYDVTRLAWFFGWPLGLSDAMFANLQDPPLLLTLGLALAALSTGGAALTHGLVARWGEVFPRWTPFLTGRRVPPLLAVIPASIVAVSLPPATFMALNTNVNAGFSTADWAVWVPNLFWVFWAIGLAGATYCYYLRRRGPCRHCLRDKLRDGSVTPSPADATGFPQGPGPWPPGSR